MLDHRIPCLENFTVDILQIKTEVDQRPSLWMGEVKHLKSKTTASSSSSSILDCWASEGLMSIIEIFTHIAWMVIQSFLTWTPCWTMAQLQRPSSFDNIGRTFTFPTFENQIILTALVLCKFKTISKLNLVPSHTGVVGRESITPRILILDIRWKLAVGFTTPAASNLRRKRHQCYWIGCWVDPRASLNILENTKSLASERRISNFLVLTPVA